MQVTLINMNNINDYTYIKKLYKKSCSIKLYLILIFLEYLEN
jgi:hypothetical protein